MIQELRPKTRFQETDAAPRHAELAASKAFKDVLAVALAELTMTQPRPETLEAACRCHYELLGARRFIDILLNLSEPETPGYQRPSDNLVWQPKPQPSQQTQPQSRRPRQASQSM